MCEEKHHPGYGRFGVERRTMGTVGAEGVEDRRNLGIV